MARRPGPAARPAPAHRPERTGRSPSGRGLVTAQGRPGQGGYRSRVTPSRAELPLCGPGDIAERRVAGLGPGITGKPRMRSPRMLRWISSVPPAIDCAGTDTRISARGPSSGRAGRRAARRRPDQPVHVGRLARDEAGRELAERALGSGGRPSRPGGPPALGGPPWRGPGHRAPGRSPGERRIVVAPVRGSVVDHQVDASGALGTTLWALAISARLGRRLVKARPSRIGPVGAAARPGPAAAARGPAWSGRRSRPSPPRPPRVRRDTGAG